MLSLSQLLRCVAMLVGPPCVNLTNPIPDPGSSHQQAAKRLWICVSWGSLLHEAGNSPDLEKVLWGLCTLPVSWDKWFIKGQFIPCTCPENWFNFFCICMNYTLCASLLCENSKRWNKNKRQQKALQRIKKNKQYVGGILITSFELPVLSCSQLLKITGFKKTILQCSSSRPV